MQFQLEGQVDQSHSRVRALELENESLREDLAIARAEAERAKNQAARSVGELRRQLNPLYQALRMVFGELDAIAPASEATGAPGYNDKKLAVWESWKQKLPGKRADFIQALLDHGEMTGTQLRVATHTAAGSVAGIIHELKKLGLIQKSGDKYSLKEI